MKKKVILSNTGFLPDTPDYLIKKANQYLVPILNSQSHSLGDKLQAIYSYLDEFNKFIGKYASCSKNCSHCCKMDVQITALEAEYIQMNTNKQMDYSATPFTTGHRNSCPFLENDGACGIYNFRPIPCRIFHAFGDPKNCVHGKVQFQYGSQETGYGNPIFQKLVTWVHASVTKEGGCMRDIRDFFPKQ